MCVFFIINIQIIRRGRTQTEKLGRANDEENKDEGKKTDRQ